MLNITSRVAQFDLHPHAPEPDHDGKAHVQTCSIANPPHASPWQSHPPHCDKSDAVMQYAECIYLITRGYWIFPVIVGSLSLLANVGLLSTIYRQHWVMLSLVQHTRLLPLVHLGWVRAVPAHVVVPGDIVVVQRGNATADLVLLRGSCLVEESMLSGEVRVLSCAVLSCAVLGCLGCAVLCCAGL